MTTVVTFQGVERDCLSIEDFGVALDEFDAHAQFELWLNRPEGPALCMLRNGENAWLMYLRHFGHSGFRSAGDARLKGAVDYELSNGQVDEYPASWCIPIEDCYKALAYFFVNDGLRPDWITWQES